jgi:hypothetical protein
MGRRAPNSDLDRRQLIASMCAAGSLACLGCGRLALAAAEDELPADKFEAMSNMSFEAVFQFAYVNSFIPTMKILSNRIGLETIQHSASQAAGDEVGEMAAALPSNDLAAWVTRLKKANRFWKHVLTFEIAEDTEKAFEVKITECLWAKTFRGADAADIGYSWVCHPDYAMATAFNPKMSLIRDKTLMQGDSHCNHRWEVKA